MCSIRKQRRTFAEQQPYNQQKHTLLSGCKDNCRQKCCQKFTDEVRQVINNNFWKLTFGERRLWLDSHILISPVKSRKTAKTEHTRNHTIQYSLPLSSTKENVCKTMFLRTLGLKTDGMTTEFIAAKTKQGSNLHELITDRRGKSETGRKRDSVSIKDHINSFNPQISHYNRENAPNRRYLEPHLTIKDMCDDYNSKYEPVDYITYYREFKIENIAFGIPKQDACELCMKWDTHLKEAGAEHIREDCEHCIAVTAHNDRRRTARQHYQDDTTNDDDNTALFTADMQKIILLPKMETKEHFFVSRLVVFNETFASVKQDVDYVMLWHEAISGRLATDVSSSYIKCVNRCGKDKVIFWVDNCTGQNKNWYLFTALVWCVNADWGPSSITMKYFERGHSFMRADSVHGNIGKKMNKCPEICTFDDFVEICDKARATICPIVMQYNEFYMFLDGHRARQSKKVQVPKLQGLSVVEFRKGSRSMFYQSEFEGEVKEVDFLKPKFKLDAPVVTRDQPRGIPYAKKQNILKLAQAFPAPKRRFWLDLPVNNDMADLVTDFE